MFFPPEENRARTGIQEKPSPSLKPSPILKISTRAVKPNLQGLESKIPPRSKEKSLSCHFVSDNPANKTPEKSCFLAASGRESGVYESKTGLKNSTEPVFSTFPIPSRTSLWKKDGVNDDKVEWVVLNDFFTPGSERNPAFRHSRESRSPEARMGERGRI
jgi:hypothetical protein